VLEEEERTTLRLAAPDADAFPQPESQVRGRREGRFGAASSDWRRAIVMAEVLSSPVALRASEPLGRRF